MSTIYQDDYILVDYINIVQGDINNILDKGYNIGFTSDEIIVYITKGIRGLRMFFLDKDGENFSEYHYTEKLIKNLYKRYKFKAIIAFKIKEDILNKPLEDSISFIHKSLEDVRCTFCDDASCQYHRGNMDIALQPCIL